MGVVNRYNYEGRLHEIPVKAFGDIYVSCRNPAGRYAINSSVRRKRHKKLKDFSSLFKGEDYIVISIDGKYHRDPFARSP